MKLGIVGLVMILLLCSGCSSKDVQEALDEKAYKMVYTFDGENNFYDTKGVCYTEWGKEKECRRILENDPNVITYEFVNATSDISAFVVDGVVEKIRHREIKDGQYTGYHYIYNLVDDYKTIENRTQEANQCEFALDNENPSRTLKDCGDDLKKAYETIYSSYEDIWDDMDISEKKFIDYVENYTSDHKVELEQVVNDKLVAQKPYTAKEVETKLKANYTFTKNTKDEFVLTSLDKKANLSAIKVNNKIQYYTYVYDAYSGPKSPNQMLFMYYPEMQKKLFSNKAGTCLYNVSDDRDIGDQACTKEQIQDGKGLESGLTYMLKKMDMTKEDIIGYFEGKLK